MPKSLNKAQLIGYVGKDPDMRYTQGGVAVASFSVATDESWKDADGNAHENTQWHNIVAWRKLAEIIGEYVKKGSRLYVEGKIQHRSYDDKNTGAKKYITEIVADQILLLSSKGQTEAAPPQDSEPEKPAPKDDSLPF